MIATLTQALEERGYDSLTDVQQAVSDPGLISSDLLVSAQTGSGKTVGFGLAIAPTLLGDEDLFGPAALPLALIVAPTRELAMQVKRELAWLYGKTGARLASCVGGMDMRDERRALDRGAHIVVGTPGRLVDHIDRGSLDLSDLRAVVLDEADEMLDMGFREDLEFMLDAAPDDRRTLLFSATVPPVITKIAAKYQRDAVRISTISKETQHSDITYQALKVAQADAENAIINVLRYHDAQNAIVFANTRAMVARLTARFSNRGFPVVSLSGELSQSERTHALQSMRDGRARVCVATDVAARGIDLPKLDLVVHAELPNNTEALLHRSGRTGRAGRKGTSTLIVPPRSVKRAQNLLKWAKLQAEWVAAPSADDIRQRDQERLVQSDIWSEAGNDSEQSRAAQLLEQFSPEQIALSCVRLYEQGLSAPEDLAPAPEDRPKREKRDHSDFGPSAWVKLSIGRANRAEPRWLLPMLCRAGGLEKPQIGKIRIGENESYVEISEPAIAPFLNGLKDGALEDGVTASAHAGLPPSMPRVDDPRRAPKGKPAGKFAPKQRDGDWQDRKPHRKGGSDTGTDKPRKPKFDKPGRTVDEKSSTKPDWKPEGKKPAAKKGKPAGKPAGKRDFDKKPGKPKGSGVKLAGKAGASRKAGKPKPAGKPGAKPKKPRTKAPKGGDATPRRRG